MELHILLVGDDADHADAMRRALVRMEAGVRVTTAARLERALEALRDPAIRCVVTDVRLPDADGVRVLKALRTARRELPVIVVTANGSEELAVAAMKLGAADYVSRHARYTEELPVLVREALGRSVLSAVHEACLDGGVPALAGPVDLPDKTASEGLFDLPYGVPNQRIAPLAEINAAAVPYFAMALVCRGEAVR